MLWNSEEGVRKREKSEGGDLEGGITSKKREDPLKDGDLHARAAGTRAASLRDSVKIVAG